MFFNVIRIFFMYLLFLTLKRTHGACTLPISKGTWVTSSRGTWTVGDNQTYVENFRSKVNVNQPTVTLSCEQNSADLFVLGFQTEILTDIILDYYICLEIPSQISPKYIIYIVTETDAVSGDEFTSNLTAACDNTGYRSPQRTLIAISADVAVKELKITLPNVVRGVYDANVTFPNGQTGNETIVNVCNDTSIISIAVENATRNVGFSSSGVLFGMNYSTIDSTTFIYTSNNDTATNGVTTYSFVCWAVESTDGYVHATVFPELCQDGQNGTAVPSGGQILVLNPSATSSEDADDVTVYIIIGIVIGVILIVAAVIFVFVCLKKRHQPQDEESRPLPENMADERKKRPLNSRPKSSSDVSKMKLSKGTATMKKPVTKNVAVQASIWMGPINPANRTKTALKECSLPSTPPSPNKFVPYIGYIKRPLARANTDVEKASPMLRSSTTLERSEPPNKRLKCVPKRKTVENSPRETLITHIKDIDRRSLSHYSSEFERLHPFPREGNPQRYITNNDLINSTDKIIEPTVDNKYNELLGNKGLLDESSILDEKTDNASKREEPKEEHNVVSVSSAKTEKKTVDFKENENKPSDSETPHAVRREKTFNTEKSRPSTTEGRIGADSKLGVNLEMEGSVRKVSSANMDRSRHKLTGVYSYNSPYALSRAQKEYVTAKRTWVRQKVLQSTQNKQQFQVVRRQENERAFEKWLKEKTASVQRLKMRYSRARPSSPKRRLSRKSSLLSKKMPAKDEPKSDEDALIVGKENTENTE
ncbi:uncharacterized protein LOC128208376 [Mya arenaria]|uniref:uncharacterized protein LOC128208376 n=1 Tax=Mya arenaria TaxID=6604 RepID=UPI0022E58C09|nr:uncharacterized protein LOC128208376 [Mya arenaria]